MTGPPRLDVTTALFLDLRHPASSLTRWESLTTGVPAAVAESAVARRVAATVAASQGAEAGLVARSTLHALTDVFTELPRAGDVVAVDEAAYFTTLHAARLARRPGVAVRTYRHHRPDTLPSTNRRLLVATDGWCPGCSRPPPIAELRSRTIQNGGLLIVDDSLAFGVLGRRNGSEQLGDGTGTVRWLSHSHDGVLWLASFAKAYGTPITVLTGPRNAIDPLRSTGSRLHASPPSAPDLFAAWRALTFAPELRRRRLQLQSALMALRAGITGAGLAVTGLPFPVVAVPMPVATARRWWERLGADGIDAIVQLPRCRSDARLSFVVRSQHSPRDIDRIVSALRHIKHDSSAA